MRASAYIGNYQVVFTRRARENAVLNFKENLLFVLDTLVDRLPANKIIGIRNEGFEYDILVLKDDITKDLVVLSFEEIHPRHQVDILFTSKMAL